MAETTSKPVIFLAFANDRDETVGYLRNLPDEARRLSDVLRPAEQAGLCEVVVKQNSTAGDIFKVFQDPKYRHRIAIFHYGGHANGYQLLLESPEGKAAAAEAGGLAAFLAQQQGLQLVFLNGCSTQQQTQELLDANISMVISTSRSIDDKVATDFAFQFYQGLAGKVTIRAAYEEAAASVRTAKGDNTRALYFGDKDDPKSQLEADRWPWNLYLREGSESADGWNLPDAADNPLAGLPPLPLLDLPEELFKHLNWFTRDDAEVFFGRGHQIRELYNRLTDPRAEPIVLFYGQSGVGKSSLLAAGLLPRLERDYEVSYVRREKEGLLATLRAELLPEADDMPIETAWLAKEERTGKPLIVFLDQVEEFYTRPIEYMPDELEQLLRVVKDTFNDINRRPKGKLVLGFREEWLAKLETRVKEYQLPRSEVHLEPLDRRGIIEAVLGPARSQRLRERYALTVEEGLAEMIADDMLADRGSAISTTLQILLSKMWAEARQAKEPNFSRDLYLDLKDKGILLEDFLDQQLKAFEQRMEESAKSGLLLDVLAQHTTKFGTANESSREHLLEQYSHVRHSLGDLLQHCQDLHLLTVPTSAQKQSTHATRLTHDTLAPYVRAEFDKSDRPGQRARRTLDSRSVDWSGDNPGTPLDEADLKVVERGKDGTRTFSAIEKRLVDASVKRRARHRVTRNSLITAGMLATVAITALGVSARFQWRKAEDALAMSMVSAIGHDKGAVNEVEMDAFWDLATIDSERARLRLFELGLEQPKTTMQIRRRGDYLVTAAVGLSARRRDALRRLILKRLQSDKSQVMDFNGLLTLMERATCVEIGCALELSDREFANAAAKTFIEMSAIADDQELRDIVRLFEPLLAHTSDDVRKQIASKVLERISKFAVWEPPDTADTNPGVRLEGAKRLSNPSIGRLAESCRIVAPYCDASEFESVVESICISTIHGWSEALAWHKSGIAVGRSVEGYEGLDDLDWLRLATRELLQIQNDGLRKQLNDGLVPIINAAIPDREASDSSKESETGKLFGITSNQLSRLGVGTESAPRPIGEAETSEAPNTVPPRIATTVAALHAIAELLNEGDRNGLAVRICHYSVDQSFHDEYRYPDESLDELIPAISKHLRPDGRLEVAYRLSEEIRPILDRLPEANVYALQVLSSLSVALRTVCDASIERHRIATELLGQVEQASSLTKSPIRLRALAGLLFLARDLDDAQSIQNVRRVVTKMTQHCFSGSLTKDLQQESRWSFYPLDLHLYELQALALLPESLSECLDATVHDELTRGVAQFHRDSLTLLETEMAGESGDWDTLFTDTSESVDYLRYSREIDHLKCIAEACPHLRNRVSDISETQRSISSVLQQVSPMLPTSLALAFVSTFSAVVDDLPEEEARSCASAMAIHIVRGLIADREERRVWEIDSRWFIAAAESLDFLSDRLDAKTRHEMNRQVLSILAVAVRDPASEASIWSKVLEIGSREQPAETIAEILKHPALTRKMRTSLLRSVGPERIEFDSVWEFVDWADSSRQHLNLDAVPSRPSNHFGEPVEAIGETAW